MDITIVNNSLASRFETEIDGHLAFIDYVLGENLFTLTHTEVPPELGGQGVGGKLVWAALDFARRHQLLVVPHCPFVRSYIDKHAEYRELVAATTH